jgi:hypothetical protein
VLSALSDDLTAASNDEEQAMSTSRSIDVRAERLVPADLERTWQRILALPQWWPWLPAAVPDDRLDRPEVLT